MQQANYSVFHAKNVLFRQLKGRSCIIHSESYNDTDLGFIRTAKAISLHPLVPPMQFDCNTDVIINNLCKIQMYKYTNGRMSEYESMNTQTYDSKEIVSGSDVRKVM